MELTNFGAIMKFALERENDIKSVLDFGLKNQALSSLVPGINEMIRQNQNNIKILERTRREDINEVVLHPVADLDDQVFLFELPSIEGITKNEFLSFLEVASARLSRFYSEAGEKLHTDDAKRVFQKLAKKKYV